MELPLLEDSEEEEQKKKAEYNNWLADKLSGNSVVAQQCWGGVEERGGGVGDKRHLPKRSITVGELLFIRPVLVIGCLLPQKFLLPPVYSCC